MNLKCLSVDNDLDNAGLYFAIWAERGIDMDRVDNMTEAIQKLLIYDYIFVGINGDIIDFMPLLRTMRSVSSTPIMIVTGNFTTEKEIAALESGADLYARWHNNPEENVLSVLAHITRVGERNKTICPVSNIMIYNNLLVEPHQKNAFIGNRKLELTAKEYDVLCLLMENHGCILSSEEIYKRVWKLQYDSNSKLVVWSLIKRLRKKLQASPQAMNYIKTLREVGYSYDPD